MDLQLAFAQLAPQDPAFEQRLKQATNVQHPSHHPLWKLRRAIRLNLIFGTVITVGYLGLFPFIGDEVVLAFFALVLMYNVWSLVHTLQLYRRIPDHVPADHDLMSVLRQQVATTTAWMKLHQRTGLIMYPLAVTAGFLLGGMQGSGLPPELFLAKPAVRIALVIALIVLVPVCYFLVRWMTHVAFGVHVEALRTHIADLEA
jgi:hypothetical protein